MTTLNLTTPARRTLLQRRIQLLVAATITYNMIEAAVAITAGTIASSAALIGFGLDSIVEVSSTAAVAWQFSAADHERRERAALHGHDEGPPTERQWTVMAGVGMFTPATMAQRQDDAGTRFGLHTVQRQLVAADGADPREGNRHGDDYVSGHRQSSRSRTPEGA
ncbi:hypothetical protein GCM10022419_131740 [Nonomuraea rosea]|uniref:Cation transporter n=1 Tax=Nonomuraea rosea TaxID=638574 RepID=A0ABP7A2M0_9ACTN